MTAPKQRDFSNLDALELFWRRTSFHDMGIEEVTAINRRVIIRLDHYTLVVTGTTELKRCEMPTIWLYHAIRHDRARFHLDVETGTGRLSVSGADVRLLRNSDLALLIPPVDT